MFDDLSGTIRTSAETVAHGGLGVGGEAVLNVPVTERLAVRAVGYENHAAGWIDETDGRRNGNIETVRGGRLAVRWLPVSDWTIDVGGAIQHLDVADSQYVTASDDTLRRSPRAPEPADNDFHEVAATLSGRVADLELTSATSYVDHGIDQTFDAPTATTMDEEGRRFLDHRTYRLFNQELRLSQGGQAGWLAGVSFLRSTSRARGVFDTGRTTSLVEDLNHVVTEYAAFGEKTVRLSDRLSTTGGLRLFRTVAEDETVEGTGGIRDAVGNTVLAPSLSVSWKPRADLIAFARYARSVAPAGWHPSAWERRDDSTQTNSARSTWGSGRGAMRNNFLTARAYSGRTGATSSPTICCLAA